MQSILSKFRNAIAQSASGTLIHATALTIRKPISTIQLRESLGRRFTVTLARPDFGFTSMVARLPKRTYSPNGNCAFLPRASQSMS